MHHKNCMCPSAGRGGGRGLHWILWVRILNIEYYGKFSGIFKHLHCCRRGGHARVAEGAKTTPVVIMWAIIHSLHCCNTLAPFPLHFPSIKCFHRQTTFPMKISYHIFSLDWFISRHNLECSILTVPFPVGGEGGMPRRLRTAYTNTQVWKWTISIYNRTYICISDLYIIY